VQARRSLETCVAEAQTAFGLPPGSYDFYDRFGKLEYPEDLHRALETAGSGECLIEVREHNHFTRLRDVETENLAQNDRMADIEAKLRAAEERAEANVQSTKEELQAMIEAVRLRLVDEVVPTVEDLCRDRTQMQKDLRKAQEKLRQINVRELHEMKQDFEALKEEMKAAVTRVDRIDTMWQTEKAKIEEDVSRNQKELEELRRFVQGKIEVLVAADADLARESQVLDQRLRLLADDVSLLGEDLKQLGQDCNGVTEKEQELRTLMDEAHSFSDRLQVHAERHHTRLTSLEIAAMENWNGFFPGVLYFKHWHRDAKANDIQHSADLSIATGRGNLTATGVVIGSDEGIAVANGPCRRFGSPGQWVSYYEIDVDEIRSAPQGSGGLFAGVTIQSGEEILAHPQREFDGWLVGGKVKALICRAGLGGDEPPDPEKLPATWMPGAATETAAESVREAVDLLRLALPPRARGEIREVDSNWASEELTMGDRIGVLFKCKPAGGAQLRVAVNGVVKATHDFMDAPPADAVGFLTPVVRLSGTGKSVRLLRGAQPPPEILADL